MATIVMWTCIAFLLYVHVGYPLMLWAWSTLAARPVRKGFWEPTVSILIAAHNEHDTIEQKIQNCLELDYPLDKLQIVIALDAPTDGTDLVAASYESQNVHVVSLRKHLGKAGALNRAMAASRGSVLVFSDARQRLDRAALRELVANLLDPEVGSVSGELVLLDDRGQEAADGLGLYWRYEKWLRAREAQIHSMMGATGAIYAIRREFYKRMQADTILDDVCVPMNIVLRGKRAVFDGAARAYDRVSASPEIEYGRKVRTLMGNFQILARMPALMSPLHNPVWVQYMSHKAARLMVPYAMAALFIANLFVRDGIYLWLLIAQCAFYSLAGLGGLFSHRIVSKEDGNDQKSFALSLHVHADESGSGRGALPLCAPDGGE